MKRSKRRARKAQRPKEHRTSLFGSIALEVIGLAAFLLLLTAAKYDGQNHNLTVDRVADRTTEYSSLFTGFLSDQVQRHGVFAKQ